MNKAYSFLAVLCVAATSLTSCSRSNYSFNNQVPAYLGSERVQPVAKATPVPATIEAVTDIPAATTVAATPAPATTPAKVVVATPISAQATPAVVAAAPAIASTPVAKAAKPSLIQRLALKSVVRELNKMHQKQATAGTEKTASKKGNAALIALGGILLAVLGLIIVGGSGLGGSGAGVAIGAILFYVGFIAFIVGVVLLVIHLVNGD